MKKQNNEEGTIWLVVEQEIIKGDADICIKPLEGVVHMRMSLPEGLPELNAKDAVAQVKGNQIEFVIPEAKA